MIGRRYAVVLVGVVTVALLSGCMRTDGGTTDAARAIAPMLHWTNPTERVYEQGPLRALTNMRTAIGYDDPDMDRSIEEFPQYVSAIAGYDVAAAAEQDPTSTFYACAAAGEDGPRAWCSTRFRWTYNGQPFDVTVEVGDRGYGETGKPAEVTVLHNEN